MWSITSHPSTYVYLHTSAALEERGNANWDPGVCNPSFQVNGMRDYLQSQNLSGPRAIQHSPIHAKQGHR